MTDQLDPFPGNLKQHEVKPTDAELKALIKNAPIMVVPRPDADLIQVLVDALGKMKTDTRNCLKRIEKDGSLNHGPTCLSPVKAEFTHPDDYCWVCRFNTALSLARDRGYTPKEK